MFEKKFILNEDAGNNEGGTATPSGDNANAPKTFTQEEVNKIVEERINRVYSSYGVKNKDELDKVVENTKNLDAENKALKKEKMLSKFKIDDSRKEDVDIYFKGSGLEFNEENLEKVIKTHREWVVSSNEENNPASNATNENKEKTAKVVVGAEKSKTATADEELLKAEKIFGIKFKTDKVKI